jgi:hypothetical protein
MTLFIVNITKKDTQVKTICDFNFVSNCTYLLPEEIGDSFPGRAIVYEKLGFGVGTKRVFRTQRSRKTGKQSTWGREISIQLDFQLCFPISHRKCLVGVRVRRQVCFVYTTTPFRGQRLVWQAKNVFIGRTTLDLVCT